MILFIVLGSLDYYNFIPSNDVLRKMTNLGLIPAIFQLSLLTYAYITNERLRKFVYEMYTSCFH